MSSSLSSHVPCARENQDVFSDVATTSGPAIVWGRTRRVGDPGVVQIDADPLVEDSLKPALNLRTSGEDAGPSLRQPVEHMLRGPLLGQCDQG